MSTVQRIKQPIEAEMELFEKKFYDSMASQVPLLNRITYYSDPQRKTDEAHVCLPLCQVSG